MDFACSHPQKGKEGDNIIEIYDFPAALKTTDLLSVFSEYRNAGFFIRWVNDTHALGVFSGPAIAQQALSKEHPQCKVGPISRACKSCKQKARQVRGVSNRGRGRGRSRGRGRPNRNRDDKRSSDDSTGTYPLHVLSSDDDNDEGTQKKFYLSDYEAGDPVATEYESVQIPSTSGYCQDQDILTKSKEQIRTGKGESFHRSKTTGCGDTGLQSHNKTRRSRTTSAEQEAQENNSLHTPVDQIVQSTVIKYCDTGHIMMRNETICRWCNVGWKRVMERDYVTLAKPMKNNVVLLENTSTDINGEVNDTPITKKNDTEVQSHHTSTSINEQVDDSPTTTEDNTEVDWDDNQQPSERKTIQSLTFKYCNAGHMLMKNENVCQQCSEIDNVSTDVESVY